MRAFQATAILECLVKVNSMFSCQYRLNSPHEERNVAWCCCNSCPSKDMDAKWSFSSLHHMGFSHLGKLSYFHAQTMGHTGWRLSLGKHFLQNGKRDTGNVLTLNISITGSFLSDETLLASEYKPLFYFSHQQFPKISPKWSRKCK